MHEHARIHACIIHKPLFEIYALVFKVDFEDKLVFENIHIYMKIYTYTGVSTGSPLRGGQRLNTTAKDARRRAVAEFER